MGSVKNGGSRANAAKVEVKNDVSWEYTLLGSQNAWIEEIEVLDSLKGYLARGKHRSQVYRGEMCALTGASVRRWCCTNVGKRTRLSVSE